MWPRLEAAEFFKALDWDQGWKLLGGFSSPTLTFAKRPGANQRNWHRNTIWQQTWVELRQQAGQERGKRRCGKGYAAGRFSKPWVGPRKAASFKTSKHFGNRQARNVAKAAVLRWKLQGCFSSLGLRPRVEAAGVFQALCWGANQRNWHRNTMWQQTWVETGGA